MHFGVILPNYGPSSDAGGIRRTAETADELGFHSVWTTEHIIVGPEGVDPYGRVYDPLITLSWIAGWTRRIGLGTSIVLVPLHHPIHLAKEVATLQELSEGRVTLGVGMGWHVDEYEFMGVPFERRGRRGDEALWVMRALWNGEGDFDGEFWSFHGATFGPVPTKRPEIWVGGSSPAAIRRTLELGDVWHPSRGSDAAAVAAVKQRYPELRIVPRVAADGVDAMLEAGADGAVVQFADDAAMRAFAAQHL